MKQPIRIMPDECKHLFVNEELFASLGRLSEIDKAQLYGIFQTVLHDRVTEANKLIIEQAIQKLM